MNCWRHLSANNIFAVIFRSHRKITSFVLFLLFCSDNFRGGSKKENIWHWNGNKMCDNMLVIEKSENWLVVWCAGGVKWKKQNKHTEFGIRLEIYLRDRNVLSVTSNWSIHLSIIQSLIDNRLYTSSNQNEQNMRRNLWIAKYIDVSKV